MTGESQSEPKISASPRNPTSRIYEYIPSGLFGPQAAATVRAQQRDHRDHARSGWPVTARAKGPPVSAPGEPTFWVELLLCGAASALRGAASALCGAAGCALFTSLSASRTPRLTPLRASCTPLLTPLHASFASLLTPLRPCLACLGCLACLARLACLALRCPLRLSLGV